MFPIKLKHVLMFVLAALAPLCAEAARRRPTEHPGLSLIEVSSQGGYASSASVFQGGSLTLYIASTVQPLTVEIINLADPNGVLMTIENLSSHAQNCAGQSAGGCAWEATTTIFIPSSWPSGYYAARFPTSLGQRWAPFIVRAAHPGDTSKMLVLSSTHTMQAYNRFGGPGPEDRVSYQRPYRQHDGLGVSDDEQLFVDWLTAQGLPFEVASDVDLEDATLLSRYTLVVIPGHAEYWTARARGNIEQFSRNGGHVAVLSGNVMGRQVRLEDENQTIIGTFQAGSADPEHQKLAAANWFEHPLYNPETRLFGTSFLYGGSANRVSEDDDALLPVEQRTGWTVTAPSHWIYQGTNLVLGSTFGRETVGLEVGGTLFNCDPSNGNIIGADASSGTPLNYHILAWTPASEGTGTLGIYTNSAGGAVFNAATQRWVYGLRDNPVVSRITRNVIDQLITGLPIPNDEMTAMLLTEESFNCQQYTPRLLPGWTHTLKGQAAVTERCSYEGTGGLEFSGIQGIEVVRDFTPTQPLKEIGARFYINVDAYEGQPDSPLARVTLRNTVAGQADVPLVVEFSIVDGKAQSRLVRRDSAGNVFAGDWLALGTPGWHIYWLTWRSPGQIVLQLDKIPTRTLDNPDSTQFVGEIALEYPAVIRSDNSRFVCFDGLAVGHVKPGSLPPIK